MIYKFPLNLGLFYHRKLPVILQTESAECGAVCLCMISSYWGYKIDLANMRKMFSISQKGITLKSLVAMSQSMGLKARPIKIDMHLIKEIKVPCILHWDMNHFVVLKKVEARKVVIHDPSFGEKKLTYSEFSKHFTGIALELTPNEEFRRVEKIQKFTLFSLMGNVVGLNGSLFQLFLFGVALQICALVAPFYMQWIVDEALLSSDKNLIIVLGVGFLLLVFIQTFFSIVRSWIATVLSVNLNYQWLSNSFSHLMKLPLTYFENRHTGDIVSRFGSIQTIQHSLTTQFVEGVIDGVLVLGTLIMMFLYSALLSLIACGVVSFYVFFRWFVFNKLKEANVEQIVHAAKQQTHFMESIRGVQSIRLFNRSEERHFSWMNSLTDQFNAELRVSRINIFSQSVSSFISSAERIVIIGLAAILVLESKFSIGMLFAFISYKDQFSSRFLSLIDKIFEYKTLELHGERVADIVLSEPERGRLNIYNGKRLDLNENIEIRNLSFRYSDNDPYVLKNININIKKGECLAITGASGCGKTTLLKILLGLLEPTEGEILIDGIAIKNLEMAEYRQMLGPVMQDDQLFAGSIAENISFFDPSPDQEKIQSCAIFAAIHSEILMMPMGYYSLIGDIGSGLSGGQKQRILLARALYKDPKILILDEATSQLDIPNEKAVNKEILDLNLTRIMVAHRPDTIAMAQRVIVIEDGMISEDLSRNLHILDQV